MLNFISNENSTPIFLLNSHSKTDQTWMLRCTLKGGNMWRLTKTATRLPPPNFPPPDALTPPDLRWDQSHGVLLNPLWTGSCSSRRHSLPQLLPENRATLAPQNEMNHSEKKTSIFRCDGCWFLGRVTFKTFSSWTEKSIYPWYHDHLVPLKVH